MNVLLVDDHAIFRQGVKLIIQSFNSGIKVIEAISTAQCAELVQQHEVDLILLDLKLSDTSGLDSLIAIKDFVPDIPVIVLSGEDDILVIHKTIEFGAMGFISKMASHEDLLAAIKRVISGGVYLPAQMTVYPQNGQQSLDGGEKNDFQGVLEGLSERQREILYYVLQGKPNKTISTGLDISESTVKNHISSILSSLGARNRTEAVYIAARAGVPIERPLP